MADVKLAPDTTPFLPPDHGHAPKAAAATGAKSGLVVFVDQLWIMLKKTPCFRWGWRYWPSTFAQGVAAPFIFQLLLFILQRADYDRQSVSNPHPSSALLGGIPRCQGRTASEPCVTVLYTPVSPLFTDIMSKFSTLNAQRTGDVLALESFDVTNNDTLPTAQLGIGTVTNTDVLYNYALNHPNTTTWAVAFSSVPGAVAGNVNVQYQLWFNSTLASNKTDIFGTQVLAMVRALDEAIMSRLNGADASMTVNVKDWPLVPPTALADSMVQYLGPALFFCSQMIVFISVLSQIVTEKEMKLRNAMETMGLMPAVYWLSHFLSFSLVVFTNTLVTIIFGLIYGFSIFRQSSFFVVFFTFFLFGEAMVVLAMFITCFVSKASVAVMIGIFLFIIGLLFEVVVFSGSFVGYIWWAENLVPKNIWVLLAFLPFFNFGRMVLDLSLLTNGKLDTFTGTFLPGPGFGWGTLYDNIPSNYLLGYGSTNQLPSVLPPVVSWYCMILDGLFYGLCLWYFDNVIPDEFGASRPWYFFVTPSFWGYSSTQDDKGVDVAAWLEQHSKVKYDEVAEQDVDVVEARQVALDPGTSPIMRVVNLRKVYMAGVFNPVRKVAVNNFTLSMEEGKLLALLGQNGAGKSTTMSMLSGLTPPTQGDALMYGLSVSRDMLRIRKLMGICPQHDILFDDLTAREHIELYAGLKGVPAAEMEALLVERLEAVKLTTVQNVRAVTYSGGMKRRLSLVISTIGDPQIIFMDEPTTGMDPVNRRHVWSFIEGFKKNRVIILTTHSMEEADVLGDNIAIMARGNLLAYGNSIHLKSKFGVGYRLAIITVEARTGQVKAAVGTLVPSAVLEDDSAGALIYQFPESALPAIPDVVAMLERNEGGAIKTWGISQSTLEEVFLKLIRKVAPTNRDPVAGRP